MPPTSDQPRWRSHPVLGAVLRLVAFAVPLVAGAVTATVLSRVVPRPDAQAARLAWWAGLMVASTAALALCERLTRRLLPLSILLKLSLIFPDQSPSRFAMALRSGGVRRLESGGGPRRRRTRLAGAAESILSLATNLATHDRKTRGHSERVRAFTDLVADELHLAEADKDRLRWAGLLHDVGKLSVAVEILNKPGKPAHDEWAALRRHPDEGARLTAPLTAWLGQWADVIPQHHERYDGGGYPRGLAGEEISLGARIVAVADAYDTMTSARAYKKPMSVATARAELTRCSGTHFDPGVVRAFLNISLGRLRWVVGPMGWLAQMPLVGWLPRLGIGPSTLPNATLVARTGAAATALAAGGTLAAMPAPTAAAPDAEGDRAVPVASHAPARRPSSSRALHSIRADLGQDSRGWLGALPPPAAPPPMVSTVTVRAPVPVAGGTTRAEPSSLHQRPPQRPEEPRRESDDPTPGPRPAPSPTVERRSSPPPESRRGPSRGPSTPRAEARGPSSGGKGEGGKGDGGTSTSGRKRSHDADGRGSSGSDGDDGKAASREAGPKRHKGGRA